MPADEDVFLASNGIHKDGTPREWAWVRVRARKVLGDVLKKVPFSRQVAGKKIAATPSQYDHDIGTAEQVAWRYIDSTGTVWDLSDFMLVSIERMQDELGPAKVNELRARAGKLRPWPSGFAGAPEFER
jgi:hypothetical protein